MTAPQPRGPLRALIDFLVDLPLVSGLLALLILAAGLYVAPFPWRFGDLPRAPVAVDALPDVGDNQQILYARWPGRSPRDLEDQVGYPLVTALLGLKGVRAVRSQSAFEQSTLFVIFEDDVPFETARLRLTERLASLPEGTLPEGVRALLGPDATGLGQVFWYTVEAPAGGFALHELRAIQDFTLRPALQAVPGVAEVASVGGQQLEWQVEADPEAMQAHEVSLVQVAEAVRRANQDVGAGTLEINRMEYLVRGVGRLAKLEELAQAVVARRGGIPVTLAEVAHLTEGPGPRRGVLDKGGAEVVGGVVVVRQGENPLAVIDRVKQTLADLAPGLPQMTLADGTASQVRVVPFYDRTDLIHETLETLEETLISEVLITVLVVVIMLWELRSALLVSALLPLGVLLTFVGMKQLGIGAHVMSLAGVAIAIGTMVDLGIILAENVVRHLRMAAPDTPIRTVVKAATGEVSGAVLTAVATTVLSFLPIFALTGPEARLFGPLAWTKTLALVSAVLLALLVLPALAAGLFARREPDPRIRGMVSGGLLAAAGMLALFDGRLLGYAAGLLALAAVGREVSPRLSPRGRAVAGALLNVAAVVVGGLTLALHWRPLGYGIGDASQILFTTVTVGGVLGLFLLFRWGFPRILRRILAHKLLFLSLPVVLVLAGVLVWRGAGLVTDHLPEGRLRSWLTATFPGLPTDFLPPFDEGAFLWMPSTMPHASLAESLEVLQAQDRAIAAVPEVRSVVGKLGRVDSALDPAPTSMFETLIDLVPEYGPPDPETGRRARQWRDHIRSVDDLWNEIAHAAALPGTTGAPQLQPIAARMIMLQSGMRAPMGVKVYAATLEQLETASEEIATILATVPGVSPDTVQPDRVVGSAWLEVRFDREALARYGISVGTAGEVLETAVGGRPIGTLIDGRARHTIRLRYPRGLRNDPESLRNVWVPTPEGTEVPLGELAEVVFERGPMMIKAEEGFLVAYVTFDAAQGEAPGAVVDAAQVALAAAVTEGRLRLPPGARYRLAGQFENQQRVDASLKIMVPLSLFLIFGVLYLQFRRISTALLVFSGIAVAWSGGFLLLAWYSGAAPDGGWMWGEQHLRHVFHVGPQALTLGVWVGFLALFGVASDDGVVMSTYLEQAHAEQQPSTVADLRALVVSAATRRVRPCLMTTATTLLALLPVLTSQGRGADVMLPMALPTLGGMTLALLTLFVVPVGWCGLHEIRLWARARLGPPRTAPESEASA